jgi:hypothetical protein
VEGSYRRRFDRKEYERLAPLADQVQVTPTDAAHLRNVVDEEIRSGRTPEDMREERLRALEQSQFYANRDEALDQLAEMTTKQLKIPGEPEVFHNLLHAETPDQIQEICKDAFVERDIETEPGQRRKALMRNWPISPGSVLPMYLSQYAAEFIAAKRDPRFPRSGRPSSVLKQIWFLSRALAGALYGVQTRTAINLVGSKRPEEIFHEARAGKPKRRVSKKAKRQH